MKNTSKLTTWLKITEMAIQFPTPNVSHLRSDDYQEIYEPAEDSFLFLDALEQDLDLLRKRGPSICVEIGSGSGVVITFLASLLGQSAYYLAVDINSKAVECTQRTLLHNTVYYADCICDDMLTSLRSQLTGGIDVLLFNPPYVPTPSNEVGGTGLTASWAGGLEGREVINCLLPQVSNLLSSGGIFYLVVVKENNPDNICAILHNNGLISEVVMKRRAHNEQLMVLRFIKPE